MDGSKRKNRSLRAALAVLCFLVCITAGCKKEKPEYRTKEGFCGGISVFDCLEGRSLCDKGMVKVKDGLMMFYEYETGKSYPLCSDAYCEHIPYDPVANPDPVCEATMKGLEMACIYGDYLYVIQETGICEITVQARNLKERGYRTVAKLPYCMTYSANGYNAVIGNKAYLLLAEIDNLKDDGIVVSYTTNDLYTYLVELDLQTGEYKTLFHIDDEKKYKILNTVYTEEGIYCQWYYEDVEMNEDFTGFTLHDYWDVFYYVPYDGSGAKELCPELRGLTAYKEDRQPQIRVLGIDRNGVYFTNEEMTKVERYRYDGKKETVFELPEGYASLLFDGISGDKMLMTLITPEEVYKTAGLDLATGELLVAAVPESGFYIEALDGVFWKHCSYEDEGEKVFYWELWRYEDIFSGNGVPVVSEKN